MDLLYCGMACSCDVNLFSSLFKLWLIMCCIVVGTGDHTYDRRLRLGGPLVKQNIATMVLER